ncbi:hypothetical protein FB45DRAFT_317616 [Roridomyces roridus]|uniref:Uncharacterized protein n=1 Tax=Roridomyces roridus TaxID=1738132 RepID=A0AAD7B6V4_9AGAR|nr:hypothetical protein FB45DRAFT_317616 [Roridomyces roridus]
MPVTAAFHNPTKIDAKLNGAVLPTQVAGLPTRSSSADMTHHHLQSRRLPLSKLGSCRGHPGLPPPPLPFEHKHAQPPSKKLPLSNWGSYRGHQGLPMLLQAVEHRHAETRACLGSRWDCVQHHQSSRARQVAHGATSSTPSRTRLSISVLLTHPPFSTTSYTGTARVPLQSFRFLHGYSHLRPHIHHPHIHAF